MKRVLMLALLAGVSTFGFAGCGEESKVQETTTIKTPEGTTTESTEKKIEKSGDNPPAAPSEAPK